MEENKKTILRSAGFGEEVKRVEKGTCPMCNKPVDPQEFRDALSKKEFQISGMCQDCMDEIFEG